MGKHPHICFGGGIGRRSEDSAHTWRSRLATNGLHAGSSPAQSTIFVTHNFNSLFSQPTAVGHFDVWCNGSTTDFGSVSGGSSPPTLTMYYLKKKKTDKPKKRQASQATLVKKLDKVFSQYIRLRDAFPNGTFRCISCGKIKPFDQSDCGHYHSRRHMSTRFDEENCNSECRFCNRFSADHLIGYRENLIRKIGTQRFQLLEVKAHQTKKWSCWELEELIKYYSILVKKLSEEKGIRI